MRHLQRVREYLLPVRCRRVVLAPQIAGQDNNATRRAGSSRGPISDGQQRNVPAGFVLTTPETCDRAFGRFAQDEWRFQAKQTLYYGVRYSYFGAPYDVNGRLPNFVPSLYSLANAPVVNGNGDRSSVGQFLHGMIVNAQNLQSAANIARRPVHQGQENLLKLRRTIFSHA